MVSNSTSWSLSERTSASLEVHLLGLVDFDSALFLQERLVYEISGRTDRLGGLLVCEHPPLLTVGRDGSRAHWRCDPAELTARQIDVRWLNRGGGCLIHAPGQLAVYPVVPLDRLEMGVVEYRRRLEQAVIETCRELRVTAFRQPEQPGVWCRCGQFASVGVAVKSWVTYHGMYVNVSPSMELMRLVQPFGSNDRVTSLAAQRLRSTSMHAVRSGLIRHVAEQLGYRQHHLYTGHPLLRRTTKRIYDYA